jgi:hypothetical protein
MTSMTAECSVPSEAQKQSDRNAVSSRSAAVTRWLMFMTCLTVLVCGSATTLVAQGPNAAINGQITDPQGKVVPGVGVQAINVDTNAVSASQTNDSGIYSLPSLLPGAYRMVVRKAGFKGIDKVGLVLHVQDTLEQNFVLEIGIVSETVTVEGGASMINTTDASVSTVIDHTYVENMPLNGRSFQDLILLTPGVVTQSPQSVARLGVNGEFSVNGQRTEENYFTVDGVSANVGSVAGGTMLNAGGSGSLPGATALGTTQALVSVDDLQEFRVNSSTYSAEYGRNPGGQLAFETKSGTNQWHGTAYDYLRNGFFDAQDWFNDYFGTPEPALRQNDFGGTLGGPVEVPGLYHGKDKTFFFVSYEGLRLTVPQAATASYVPDLCMRDMGPCPSGRMPAASAVLPAINAFPLPSPNGLEDATNGIGQFIGSWSNPGSIDSTSARFDHVVNDRLRLFFRFSDTTSSSAARQTALSLGTPSNDVTSAYTVRTYTAGANSVFSNRVSNEFRLNYTSNYTTSSSVLDAFGGSVPVNLAQLTGLGPGSFPSFALEYGGYSPGLSQSVKSGAQKQWNLVDSVNLSLGRHQFKFGADYRRLTPSAVQASPNLGFIYASEPSVETNSAYIYATAYGPAYPLFLNFSAFAQDQWKVSSRLSLSMGLRWDVNPPPGATQGVKPYAFEGSGPSTWTLAPQGTPLWQTTWFNLAPRLSAAYVLHDAPARETVVRGGGGVFFDTGQQTASEAFAGQGFEAEYCCAYPAPFPTGGAGIIPTIQNPPTPPYLNAVVYAPHLQLPYTLQWNASVEQALGKSQTFTVSYVGSHAARLLQTNAFNSSATNPIASDFIFIENGLTSDYNALQAKFQRRLTRGLTALAAYTWSHCIDYGSENYSYGYQRGNCDFDVRHNLSAAFSYSLPNEWHNGFANAVLHHWGLDDRLTARTAFPVTLYGNELLQPNGQYYYAGLSLVPRQPVYLYGDNCATVLQGLGDLAPGKGCPGGRAINPNAFVNVNSGFGDASRNFARGFDAVQMDLAVRREFPAYENLKLQFRAEAFNIFNHPNFGFINSYFGQPTFGQATGTLASSLGVVNPLYQQGGPRSMQFALKFIF